MERPKNPLLRKFFSLKVKISRLYKRIVDWIENFQNDSYYKRVLGKDRKLGIFPEDRLTKALFDLINLINDILINGEVVRQSVIAGKEQKLVFKIFGENGVITARRKSSSSKFVKVSDYKKLIRSNPKRAKSFLSKIFEKNLLLQEGFDTGFVALPDCLYHLNIAIHFYKPLQLSQIEIPNRHKCSSVNTVVYDIITASQEVFSGNINSEIYTKKENITIIATRTGIVDHLYSVVIKMVDNRTARPIMEVSFSYSEGNRIRRPC